MAKITFLLFILLAAACSPAQQTASSTDATQEVEAVEETIAPTNTELSPTAVVTKEPTPVSTVEVTPTPHITGLRTVIYANARSCPWMTCPVIASFAEGALIGEGEQVEGGRFEGSPRWWRVNHEGRTIYIHDSLVTRK